MRTLIVAALLATLCASPTDACGLVVGLPGAMGVDPNSDYTIMRSDMGLGTPATFTASLNLFESVNIHVGAPTLSDWADNYNPSGDVVEIAYIATALLSTLKNQPYTTQQTQFHASTLASVLNVTVSLNSRLTSASTFNAGEYETKTVVTCGP